LIRGAQRHLPMRSRAVLYSIAALLAVAGLAVATYLTVGHLTGATLVCGTSIECAAVLRSAYSQIGPVPVAALFAVGYFAAFTFATYAVFGSRRAARYLRMAVWLLFAASLWSLFVQAVLVRGFCRYCVGAAAITLVLTALVVASREDARTEN
jgi:uncharacterized membrane protein